MFKYRDSGRVGNSSHTRAESWGIASADTEVPGNHSWWLTHSCNRRASLDVPHGCGESAKHFQVFFKVPWLPTEVYLRVRNTQNPTHSIQVESWSISKRVFLLLASLTPREGNDRGQAEGNPLRALHGIRKRSRYLGMGSGMTDFRNGSHGGSWSSFPTKGISSVLRVPQLMFVGMRAMQTRMLTEGYTCSLPQRVEFSPPHISPRSPCFLQPLLLS